jgi:type VI secretion system secreted protein Hcp
MSREKIIGIAVVAALIFVGILATTSFGQSNDPPGQDEPTTNTASMFIKFDGVDGEAKDKAHKGWSDIVSFNQAISNPVVEGRTGRHRSQPSFGDVVCVKELDKSSPKIQESMTNGKVFPKVEIHLTEYYAGEGRVTYLKYELTNVMVTSYGVVAPTNTEGLTGVVAPSNLGDPSSVVGPTNTRDVPIELVSLNFAEVKVTYTELDNDGKSKGNVEYSWKVEEGEP